MNAANVVTGTDAIALAKALREERAVLLECIEDVIESRCDDDFALEAFERALKKLRDVRLMLGSEADHLAPEPSETESGVHQVSEVAK